jgi:hypothetical protein
LPSLSNLQTVTDDLLRQMFEPFGPVLHVAVLYDGTTSEPRLAASACRPALALALALLLRQPMQQPSSQACYRRHPHFHVLSLTPQTCVPSSTICLPTLLQA